MVIVISGMIGVGKTTVAKAVSKELGSEVFLESVDNNPFLEKFYTATKEDEKKYRYPFLLQLYFLNTRFQSIKQSLYDKNNVLDRSIYEDKYFCKINHELKRINDDEYKIYLDLFDNMMEELKYTPKKAPDIMIYLYASWDKICKNIAKRGRKFESKKQEEYFKILHNGYNEWIDECYNQSKVIKVNMDSKDFNNIEDVKELVELIHE